jgi:hypothetical protein
LSIRANRCVFFAALAVLVFSLGSCSSNAPDTEGDAPDEVCCSSGAGCGGCFQTGGTCPSWCKSACTNACNTAECPQCGPPPPVNPIWFPCPQTFPAGSANHAVFTDVYQYISPTKNQQKVQTTIKLPTSTDWSKVYLRLELSAPPKAVYDQFDRLGSISIVDEGDKLVELWRYVTPFGTGLTTCGDVTSLIKAFTGQTTVQSIVETEVGPQSTSREGYGWDVSVDLIYVPATTSAPAPVAPSLQNLIPYKQLWIGNPDNTLATQLAADTQAQLTFTIPASPSKVELRLLTTGHGQGNEFRCGEFCAMESQLTVTNGSTKAQKTYTVNPFRDDCQDNPIGKFQAPTSSWQESRDGWCPGASVKPWTVDITAFVADGGTYTLAYEDLVYGTPIYVDYVNSCRPDAGTAGGTCMHCGDSGDVSGPCAYNSDGHTQPFNQVSVELLITP